MKMTMQKIAELAGCSRGAVDKTIHGRPGVREDVRQKILRVIEETGYVPLIERKPRPTTPAVYTVAVVLPRLNNPYFVVLKRSMDALAEALPDLNLVYYPCDSTDVRGMLAILDQLEDVDAIIFRGVRNGRIRDRLNAMGKPVIFMDSDVSGADRLCLVGEDCYKSGRLAASLLAKSVGERGLVAVITGMSEISSHQQRLAGFLDVLRTDYPGIALVGPIYSADQSAIAYNSTLRLLHEHPDLRGICNLAGCSGEIGQAILEQPTRNPVRMVCFSTASDVADLIRKRVVSFSISITPHEQARLLIETIHAYLSRGRRPSSDWIKAPISIALDENLDSLAADFGAD